MATAAARASANPGDPVSDALLATEPCLDGEVIGNHDVVPVALGTVTRHDRRAAERGGHFHRLEEPAATVATTYEEHAAIVALEPTSIIGVCPRAVAG